MKLPPHDCQYVRNGDRIACPRCGHDREWTRQDLLPRRNCPRAFPLVLRLAIRYPLGDVVAALAVALWLAPLVKWLEQVTGMECGCSSRQAKLNGSHERMAWRMAMLLGQW